MNKTTLTPNPEVNGNIVVKPSALTIYPSRGFPGCMSLMLVSDDEYGIVESALRLTPEQTERLYCVLGEHVEINTDEGYDTGYEDGDCEGYLAGHTDGYAEGHTDGRAGALEAIGEIS